jgi:predicted nucleotidyltransferase
MLALIEDRLDAIRALCREYGVARLEVFGSAARDDFRDGESDLDFVVSFADRTAGYADRYLAVAEGLELILGRPVDLVTERAIRDPEFRREVDAARQVVYDGSKREAAA